MASETVSITAADGGKFSGYMNSPASGKGPGIVVIQEIFGINPFVRNTVDWLAGEGFSAVAPDLFWRQEPNVQLNPATEFEKAQGFLKSFDFGKGVGDLAATIGFLRSHQSCTGKVGAVGYCMGGTLAYVISAKTDVDCAVGYYGVNIHNQLGLAPAIAHPLMLHIAEQDRLCPPEAQKQMKDGLSGVNKVTLLSHPGVDHAFARAGGPAYDKATADRANVETLKFLRSHL